MTSKPIIFSAPMVRAILAGRKTMTRRIVRWPAWTGFCEPPADKYDVHMIAGTNCVGVHAKAHGNQCWGTMPSPYGGPGDRLWVRETHAWADKMAENVEREDPVCVAYRADRTAIAHEHENVHALDTAGWNWDRFKWRPSIYMPRWASRLTLEVTGVRVERLQTITGNDVIAEGAVERPFMEPGLGRCPVSAFDGKVYTDLRSLWAAGWDSINRDRAPWSTNPWVACVTFKRIEARP